MVKEHDGVDGPPLVPSMNSFLIAFFPLQHHSSMSTHVKRAKKQFFLVVCHLAHVAHNTQQTLAIVDELRRCLHPPFKFIVALSAAVESDSTERDKSMLAPVFSIPAHHTVHHCTVQSLLQRRCDSAKQRSAGVSLRDARHRRPGSTLERPRHSRKIVLVAE